MKFPGSSKGIPKITKGILLGAKIVQPHISKLKREKMDWDWRDDSRMTDLENLAKRVLVAHFRVYRRKKGLSLGNVAKGAGIDVKTMGAIEDGNADSNSAELVNICRTLDPPDGALFFEDINLSLLRKDKLDSIMEYILPIAASLNKIDDLGSAVHNMALMRFEKICKGKILILVLVVAGLKAPLEKMMRMDKRLMPRLLNETAKLMVDRFAESKTARKAAYHIKVNVNTDFQRKSTDDAGFFMTGTFLEI